jgi:hypothetical protein
LRTGSPTRRFRIPLGVHSRYKLIPSHLHHDSTAELEENKTSEMKALEAAAEKAGVKASDVEKGRKEKEERDKEDEDKKKGL